MALRDKDLAWIAGFFDGEGCICLIRYGMQGTYNMIVSVSQSNPDVLEYIRDHFGGHINVRTNTSGRLHYTLGFRRSEKQHFLLSILPFSKIKTEQIKVALQFLEFFESRRSSIWTPAMRIVAEEFCSRLKILKKQ